MRLIDADALIRDLQERYCRPCKASGLDYNGVKCKSCQFDDEIDDIDGFADNSIDIEPKRGEWIEHKERTIVRDNNFIDFFPTEYECSNCGLRQATYFINSTLPKFCPNCGASMREREGE